MLPPIRTFNALETLSAFKQVKASMRYTQDQTRKVLEEAIFNPKLGQELAQYSSALSDKQKTLTAKRLYTFLVSIGLGPDETESE